MRFVNSRKLQGIAWIIVALVPSGLTAFTFSMQSHKQGMYRRNHGGSTTHLSASKSNTNRGTWTTKQPSSLGVSSSSDDLSVVAAPLLEDASSPMHAMEIESGMSLPLATGQRSLSFAALAEPTLQQGRMLVLLAACIYGTNFSVVKLLDDTMPLSVSASLRFGLAAAVVSAIVLGKESDDVDPKVKKERNLAFWGGVEIGLWYCIGYIAQGTTV